MSPRSPLRLWLSAVTVLLACQRDAGKVPIVVDARGQSSAANASAAGVSGPGSATAKPAAEPPREAFVDPLGAATVELSGAVVFPPGPPKAGRVFVFVSHGDCLDSAVTPLRRMPSTEDGAFLLHTLATPGSQLSVCAAVEETSSQGAAGLSATYYGQAASRIRVENTNDLVLHDIQIPLRVGPLRRFADGKKTPSL